MSQWSDRIQNHAVWATLKSVEEALMHAEAVATAEDGAALEGLSRLRSVVAFAGQRLSSLDPELVHPDPVNNINSYLAQLSTYVQSFTSSKNVGHLSNANTSADAVLLHVMQLGALLSDGEVDGIRESVTNFRRAVGQHLRFVENDVEPLRDSAETLKNRVRELGDEITTQKNQVTSLSAEYQAQFSKAQEKRITEFAEAQQQRADQFTTSEKERVAEFEEQMRTVDEAIEQMDTAVSAAQKATIDELHKSLTDTTTEFTEAAEEQVKEIRRRREEAEKLLGIIGNVGITSGYQKAANEARIISWIWQLVAIGSMGGLIYIAWQAFLPSIDKQQTFLWSAFAGRVFVSLTFGVLAAYAAHQANHYQDRERRNRKTALELESLGPYLASLPDTKQEEFRLLMADRTFGRDLPTGSAEPAPTNVSELLKSKELRDFIIDLVKSAR